MPQKYRYMVALPGDREKSTEVTAESAFEALREACGQWGIRWQAVVTDAVITKIRKIKG